MVDSPELADGGTSERSFGSTGSARTRTKKKKGGLFRRRRKGEGGGGDGDGDGASGDAPSPGPRSSPRSSPRSAPSPRSRSRGRGGEGRNRSPARPRSRSNSGSGTERGPPSPAAKSASASASASAPGSRIARSLSRMRLRRRGGDGGRDDSGSWQGTLDDDDDDDDDDDVIAEPEERDPLIDLFEVHNTKRVVFDPTFAPSPAAGGGGEEDGEGGLGGDEAGGGGGGGGPGGAPSSPSSAANFNIKSFMNRIILKGGSESDAEAPEITGALAPPSPAAAAGGGSSFPYARSSPPPAGAGGSPRSAMRQGSAMRGGGRPSPGSPSSSPEGGGVAAGGGLGVKFAPSSGAGDVLIIDRAMNRSTNTAAAAAAAADAVASSRSRAAAAAAAAADASSVPPATAAAVAAGDGPPPGSGGGGGKGEFVEDPAVTRRVERLLGRANRAHARTYRYEHAIGYYLASLKILSEAGYPDGHALVSGTVRRLNDCHHAQSSLKNSANIVMMGIKHENKGEFVRALKMYTIAYRIRRDALGKFHPSLPVLLNMLGSVQVKRGELREAMQIYELALSGRPDDMRDVSEKRKAEMIHPMTKSVTLRDMGMIYERWGDDARALELYEESLAFVLKGQAREDERAARRKGMRDPNSPAAAGKGGTADSSKLLPFGNEGEMEVYSLKASEHLAVGQANEVYKYDAFFPPLPKGSKKSPSRSKKGKGKGKNGYEGSEGSNVNVAITLHQIAQINRRRQRHTVALSAYQVALRGMKQALGDRHPNVAAILGNLGNLHKEMGNYDQAYSIYQEVLGIETHHLGLCHPEVSVTLHNIATIESSRGRYADAISLYTQVVKMQKSLFGPHHISVAVTSSCMGDVYERMGDPTNAMMVYEETLSIRSKIMGAKHVDVGRLLHKLGTLALVKGDYRSADVYVTRASIIYQENSLNEDHPWMRDIRRNEADIKALVAMGARAMGAAEEGEAPVSDE